MYPSRRKTNLLTFIGVGRLGNKGFGSLRLGMVEFGRVTKITLSHHVRPFTPITKILESTTLRAFVAFYENENSSPLAIIHHGSCPRATKRHALVLKNKNCHHRISNYDPSLPNPEKISPYFMRAGAS